MLRDLAPIDFGVTHLKHLRERIQQLEDAMLALPAQEQIGIEPKHYFAHGMYAREIRIPAGTLLTGKIHRTEHINVISQGDISVMTENGIERIQAPATIISKPGTKRVGYAHTDTVWTTFHATEETDLERLEAELIISPQEFLASQQTPILEEK